MQQKAFSSHFLQQSSLSCHLWADCQSTVYLYKIVTTKPSENKAFCNPGTISECVSVVKTIKPYSILASTLQKQNNLFTERFGRKRAYKIHINWYEMIVEMRLTASVDQFLVF